MKMNFKVILKKSHVYIFASTQPTVNMTLSVPKFVTSKSYFLAS